MHKKTRRASVAIAVAVIALPIPVAGHHSPAEYDQTTVIELEGEIVNVYWRNPHVLLELATDATDGTAVSWDLEGAAVSSQRRRGVTPDLVKAGDRVRVAGFLSTRRDRHMLVEHVLLPSGVELLVGSTREPRWSETERGSSAWTVDPTKAMSAEGSGIFRVWSRGPGIWPWYFRELSEYPLTASALAIAAEFDEFEDNPLLDCTAPGMPALMGNPYPMEFVAIDGGIELRHEEFDVVRTIHLTEAADGPGVASTPLGYSIGQWDGESLVVTTSRINWPHFGRMGVPQSEAAEVLERFTVVEDGERLNYEMAISDPQTLLDTYTWEAHWIWRPGEEVNRYQCTVD
ncbi:MAG: DUF6152 family protein [Gammaproteobacteria bacterium]|jgi:hypothetical protein